MCHLKTATVKLGYTGDVSCSAKMSIDFSLGRETAVSQAGAQA